VSGVAAAEYLVLPYTAPEPDHLVYVFRGKDGPSPLFADAARHVKSLTAISAYLARPDFLTILEYFHVETMAQDLLRLAASHRCWTAMVLVRPALPLSINCCEQSGMIV